MKKILLIVIQFALSTVLFSQEEYKYIPETDPLVLKKLEQWQDLKFGLLMHWGTYSQWGIIESWSLCSEDEGWCRRRTDDYEQYKKDYAALKNTFNPVKFDPARWAEAAKAAGMKYVVFTTKHHDGFCMFDTKQTDYKITDPECPFSTDPRSNVTKEIFNAFRKEGFMVGAYFSKPDWHSDYYWWKNFSTPDRNVNYSIRKYPERWKSFVDYTHNQIDELLTDYGKVDILWLDGGWVKRMSEEEVRERTCSSEYNFIHYQNQNINMPELVRKARTKQPGIIVVDRAVTGPYQNYLTPENMVPDTTLPYPWETCMPMAGSWSYAQNDKYKTPSQLIHLLVDIVAKGGNFLLNVGPGPDGEWDPRAYDRLNQIGQWLKINGEAIYGSRPFYPYKENNICFTQKDGNVYAIYLPGDDEKQLPQQIRFQKQTMTGVTDVSLLGSDAKLKWRLINNGFEISVPDQIRRNMPGNYALVFKISTDEARH